MSFSEINVTIKDEEKRLSKKFLLYETYQVDEEDPTIQECIQETLKNFDGDPENVRVTITLEIQ